VRYALAYNRAFRPTQTIADWLALRGVTLEPTLRINPALTVRDLEVWEYARSHPVRATNGTLVPKVPGIPPIAGSLAYGSPTIPARAFTRHAAKQVLALVYSTPGQLAAA
jgi:hypothetical protein